METPNLERRKQWDMLIFFASWIVSGMLIGRFLFKVAAGYGSNIRRASFTGSPITDAFVMSVVFGL
ncbi:MAG: hypothetical protein KAI47_23630, partial [Deltaproteobacteria bacterium]|nr:hypothetical protein [Deltaproteobacteria bacterium]